MGPTDVRVSSSVATVFMNPGRFEVAWKSLKDVLPDVALTDDEYQALARAVIVTYLRG